MALIAKAESYQTIETSLQSTIWDESQSMSSHCPFIFLNNHLGRRNIHWERRTVLEANANSLLNFNYIL